MYQILKLNVLNNLKIEVALLLFVLLIKGAQL